MELWQQQRWRDFARGIEQLGVLGAMQRRRNWQKSGIDQLSHKLRIAAGRPHEIIVVQECRSLGVEIVAWQQQGPRLAHVDSSFQLSCQLLPLAEADAALEVRRQRGA